MRKYPCLQVRTKTLKFLDGNLGVNLHKFESDSNFLDMALHSQANNK